MAGQVATLDDPARPMVTGRAEEGRVRGPVGGVGPTEVAETGGLRPEGVAATEAEVRTGRVPVEETGLVPRPETVLASPLAPASASAPAARRVPVRPVGGLVVLRPAPRLGAARAARVAGDARVAQVGPAIDPIVEETGHPSPRSVRRPVTGPRPAEAATPMAEAAGQVATRVANHGEVGDFRVKIGAIGAGW